MSKCEHVVGDTIDTESGADYKCKICGELIMQWHKDSGHLKTPNGDEVSFGSTAQEETRGWLRKVVDWFSS